MGKMLHGKQWLALHRHEERLRLFAQAPDAIVVFDPETLAFVDFNDKTCQILGYTREEIRTFTVADLEVDESAEEIKRHCQRVIRDGLLVFETRHRTKSGDILCIEVRTSPIRIGNRILLQAFWRDITDRKREMLELTQAMAKARELEAIINRSPSMVFRWRALPDFPVVFVSANVTQLGYTTADFLSGRVSWMQITDPEDLPRLNQELTDYAAKGCDGFPMEYRLFRKDGSLRAMSDYTHALRDADGNIAFYESVITDVTEQKQAEQDLRQTTRELARSNKDLEQFAYVVSHDLQEPLRMVTSFLDLFQDKFKGLIDDAAREYIAFSVEGASRMSELIRGLLEYSRVRSGNVEMEPVSLDAVIEHVKANLQHCIDEVNAVITVDPLPTLKVDAGQFKMLFQNLIGNSIKFHSRNRRPEIHVGVGQEGKIWRFSVQDNGIGIDPRYSGKLFQLFQRLHTRQEYPGTGIGLALCQKIVERHGGRIWVESESGKGATFHFTVPI